MLPHCLPELKPWCNSQEMLGGRVGTPAGMPTSSRRHPPLPLPSLLAGLPGGTWLVGTVSVGVRGAPAPSQVGGGEAESVRGGSKVLLEASVWPPTSLGIH